MWQGFVEAVRQWRRARPKWVRRWIAGIVGTTILLIGIALIVLPGPALLVIPLGLAVLASEFVWAQRLLEWLKSLLGKARLKETLAKYGFRKRPSSRNPIDHDR